MNKHTHTGAAGAGTADRWGQAGEAIRFLQAFDPGGWHNLVAFDPMRGPIDGRTFPPNDWQSMADWVNDHMSSGHNLYFSVNEPKPASPDKKLKKTDIARIRAVFIDLDPQGGAAEFSAERDRIKGVVKNDMIGGDHTPTFAVDTGGGFQVFWRIKTVEAGENNKQLAETIGSALAFRFKGDAVQNVDRIMRLPGTMNFPNARKKAKGRLPRMATVIHEKADEIHSLKAWAAECPPPPERDRPRNKAEGKKWEQYADLIDMEAVRAADTYEDLPAELRKRFEEALQKSAALRSLWERGEKKEDSDRSGSGYVISLGYHLARLGFSLQDFAHLAWAWEFTPGDSGRTVNGGPRSLSRAWAKASAAIAADEQRSAVARLNQTRAIVLIKGKTRVLLEAIDSDTGLPVVEFATVHDQADFFANDLVQGSEKPISAFTVWFTSRQRRQFTSVVFEPGKPPAGNAGGFYNLWRGFIAPDPRPNPGARCALFLKHLRDNVCREDGKHYRWLQGWMAQMVQQPEKKPGVAVALRGGRGVGKSMVGRYLGAICPAHHVIVSQPSQLTGRFNAHLASALLVQAEEAMWAGDKSGEGALKELVTADRCMIEPKGVDAFLVRSCVRVIKLSNEDWVVPAGPDERRFAVFDVGDAHKQDHAYFGAIEKELAAGGASALLAFLQAFDLSTVDVWQAPATAGLLDQKLLSLRSEARWLYDCLSEGNIPGYQHRWPERVECEEMYRLYKQSAEKKEWPVTKAQFGKTLFEILPAAQKIRPWSTGARPSYYALPVLQTARAQFCKWIGHQIVWDESNDVFG